MNPTLWMLAFRGLPALAPWVALIAGLAATATVAISTHRQMKLRDKEQLRQEAEQTVTQVETRLRTYCQALLQLKDWYFERQTNMTDRVWRNYIASMHIPANYPGLFNVGFAECVYDPEVPYNFQVREEHLLRLRRRLGPDYAIHPPEGIQTNAWYHMPVIWHSYAQWRRDPERAYRHYGMDLNEDRDLWAAMNWALGQDVPALSARQRLDPDDSSKHGLMMFVPVYRERYQWNVELPDHIPGRLTHLRGLIFGGIELEPLLKEQWGTNAPALALALYASTTYEATNSPGQLLFDNRPASARIRNLESETRKSETARQGSIDGEFNEVRNLPLYGRTLHFVFEPGPAFISAVSWRTLGLMAGFGAATTLLLAGFIAYQARAHRTEREISAALRQSEIRLQSMLHERERMSRDLHDGTIQSLYAIGLGLGRLKRSLSNTHEKERLDASLAELDHVVAELRSYLVVLDPGVSPAQSAASALSQLVARLKQTTATELRFVADPGAGDGWPAAAVLELLQAAREGVSNALRHGQATQVELSLHHEPVSGGAQLTIADNGIGFDPALARTRKCRGLANLERRASAWNGSLRVESHPGGPTRLILALNPTSKLT